jgi:hypothetical protein
LLGHWGTTLAEFHLRTLNRVNERDLTSPSRDRATAARPRRQHLPRCTYSEDYHTAGRGGHAAASHSRSAASRATSRRKRPDRSTRAGSSVTRLRMRTARHSTTPICWLRA